MSVLDFVWNLDKSFVKFVHDSLFKPINNSFCLPVKPISDSNDRSSKLVSASSIRPCKPISGSNTRSIKPYSASSIYPNKPTCGCNVRPSKPFSAINVCASKLIYSSNVCSRKTLNVRDIHPSKTVSVSSSFRSSNSVSAANVHSSKFVSASNICSGKPVCKNNACQVNLSVEIMFVKVSPLVLISFHVNLFTSTKSIMLIIISIIIISMIINSAANFLYIFFLSILIFSDYYKYSIITMNIFTNLLLAIVMLLPKLTSLRKSFIMYTSWNSMFLRASLNTYITF